MNDFIVFSAIHVGGLVIGLGLIGYAAYLDGHKRKPWTSTTCFLVGMVIAAGGTFIAFVVAH